MTDAAGDCMESHTDSGRSFAERLSLLVEAVATLCALPPDAAFSSWSWLREMSIAMGAVNFGFFWLGAVDNFANLALASEKVKLVLETTDLTCGLGVHGFTW